MRVVALIALVFVGCDDGGESDGVVEVTEDVPMRRVVADEGVGGGDADPGDDDDGALAPDGAPTDGGPTDGPPLIRELETCDDICDVYEECGRLDAVGGDREACLQLCADAEPSPRFMGYRSCVQIADCETVARCVIPPKPLPSCEEICAAADACDADFRLPAGLPDFDDCAAACAAIPGRISECGRDLVEVEPDACDEPGFARCLLELEAPDCLDLCERVASCDESVDAIDCTLACLVEEPPGDPLALRRYENRRRCISDAAVGACEVIDACDLRVEADPEDVAAVCEADAECAFFDAEQCAEVVGAVLPGLFPGAPMCFGDALAACDEGPLVCFRPRPALAGVCDEHCHVQDLCEQLPEGVSELECAEDCRARRGEAGLEGALRCVVAGTCAELGDCLAAADPVLLCAAMCARRAECELDAEGCAEGCEARFDTSRVQAEIGCTAAAGSCDGVGDCVADPAPECDVVCDAYTGCDLGEPRCLADCDNAHFADAGTFLPHAACVLAGDCDDRRACQNGDLEGGAACLGWCRHHVECSEDAEATMVECLTACGEGYEGRTFLTFDAAAECLTEAEGCEALAACVDDVTDDAYCDDLCGEEVRCGLRADGEDCAAACVEDADARVDEAACVIAEMRGQNRCRPVAVCTDAGVEEAGPGCASFCRRQVECDPEVDDFLCERECTPEPEDFPVRAACVNRVECDDQQRCLDADAAIPQGCVDVCGGLSEDCGDLFGEGRETVYDDADHCSVDCTAARIVNGADDYLAELPECIDAAMCNADGIEACLVEPNSGCGQAWDYVVACMANPFFPAEAAFLAACTPAQASCIIDQVDALGGPDPLGLCGLLLVACI